MLKKVCGLLIVFGGQLIMAGDSTVVNTDAATTSGSISSLLFLAPVGAILALVTAFVFFNKVRSNSELSVSFLFT